MCTRPCVCVCAGTLESKDATLVVNSRVVTAETCSVQAFLATLTLTVEFLSLCKVRPVKFGSVFGFVSSILAGGFDMLVQPHSRKLPESWDAELDTA